MKIFVVVVYTTSGSWADNSFVGGVYSSKELAAEAKKQYEKDKSFSIAYVDIDEMKLDA